MNSKVWIEASFLLLVLTLTLPSNTFLAFGISFGELEQSLILGSRGAKERDLSNETYPSCLGYIGIILPRKKRILTNHDPIKQLVKIQMPQFM